MVISDRVDCKLHKKNEFPNCDKWTPSLASIPRLSHEISGYLIYFPPKPTINDAASLFNRTAARFMTFEFLLYLRLYLGKICDQINLVFGSIIFQLKIASFIWHLKWCNLIWPILLPPQCITSISGGCSNFRRWEILGISSPHVIPLFPCHHIRKLFLLRPRLQPSYDRLASKKACFTIDEPSNQIDFNSCWLEDNSIQIIRKIKHEQDMNHIH